MGTGIPLQLLALSQRWASCPRITLLSRGRVLSLLRVPSHTWHVPSLLVSFYLCGNKLYIYIYINTYIHIYISIYIYWRILCVINLNLKLRISESYGHSPHLLELRTLSPPPPTLIPSTHPQQLLLQVPAFLLSSLSSSLPTRLGMGNSG